MDEKAKTSVLKKFTYGIYVITSNNDDMYCSSTVTWVTQASFSPPMILVCIKKESLSYDVIKDRGEFILHVLSKEQKNIASSFFKPSTIENGYINGHKFSLKNGIPLINEVPSYLFCKVVKILNIGDHPIFLSEVRDANFEGDISPLSLQAAGWNYGG